METRARRQGLLLAGLLVVFVATLWWNLGGDAPTPVATKPKAAVGRHAAVAEADPLSVEDVEIGALAQVRPEPGASERNPFRFKPKPPPPPPAPPASQPNAEGGSAAGPGGAVATGPPPPPPIPLKFIGMVEEPERHRKLAALSDGRFTYYGREGDIIEGRYRILRIGVESIEIVYVDGRGQQTIRLSGS